MDGIAAHIRKRPLLLPLAVSALFHLLLLVFMLEKGRDVFLPAAKGSNEAAKRPIAFELVESPEYAQTDEVQNETNLLSDKNALAQDLQESELPEDNTPYSKGMSNVKNLPVPPAGGGQSRPQPESRESNNTEAVQDREQGGGETAESAVASSSSMFSRDRLLGRASRAPTILHKQTESSARNTGGISFNTYKWEYAPYLLELKRRIQKNIYPPTVFTRLGFGGDNVLRFRIYPDGRLQDLQVLEVKGEEALARTSRKAVELSAPFPPLPEDFPEDFLEVTARFQYHIY